MPVTPDPWLNFYHNQTPGASAPMPSFEGVGFDDPFTAQLQGMLQGNIGRLSGPVTPSAEEQSLMAMLRGRMGGVSLPGLDTLEGYVDRMQDGSPAAEFLLNLAQRGAPQVNPTRMATQAGERVEATRQAAMERARGRASSRGITPASGIFEAETQELDSAYDSIREAAIRDAMIDAEKLAQNAYGLTTSAGSAAAGAESAHSGQLLSAINALLGGQQYGDSQTLGAAQLLGGMGAGFRGEQTANANQALALAGMLAELPERRLALAQSIMTGQPSNLNSIFGNLSQLVGLGQNQQGLWQQQQQFNAQQNGAFGNSMGSLLAMLLPMLMGGGGGGWQELHGPG
jgi:hypothetical protein